MKKQELDNLILLGESQTLEFKKSVPNELEKEIRKIIHNDEWWFVIEDVIFALTDSKNPKGYIKAIRRRDAELAKGWWQIATPLSIETVSGIQKINCASEDSSIEEKQYPMGRELSNGFHPKAAGGLI